MLSQFITVGLLILFCVMLPGPDFAIVTRNTLLYSRTSGIFTALGIAAAVLIHILYCTLGIAIVIATSPMLLNFIKVIGSAYLFYLGFNSLLHNSKQKLSPDNPISYNKIISNPTAFKQGFLCNLLNPKAIIFFLAIFSSIIKPSTPLFFIVLLTIEMLIIVIAWFCFLSIFLSNPTVRKKLQKAEKYISKITGIILIYFAITLLFYNF